MVYAARYFKPFIGTQQVIGTGAVTSEKIQEGAVDSLQIKNQGVKSADIADGAVLLRHLGPDVPAIGIPDGSITEQKLADNSVSAAKIKTGAVTSTEIGLGAVTVLKLGDASVETVKIKDDAVTEDKILNAAVTPGKVSVGFGRFVQRKTAVVDKTLADFTADGLVHVDGLDLSLIVPVGAIAVALSAKRTAGSGLGVFYANQTDMVRNTAEIFSLAVAGILPLDVTAGDRLVDYKIDATVTGLELIVAGWFI